MTGGGRTIYFPRCSYRFQLLLEWYVFIPLATDMKERDRHRQIHVGKFFPGNRSQRGKRLSSCPPQQVSENGAIRKTGGVDAIIVHRENVTKLGKDRIE